MKSAKVAANDQGAEKDQEAKLALYFIVMFTFIWIVTQILFALPDSISDDWKGWRQADTQTIAKNFSAPGSQILYPQIDWGGDGPGYVEAEFQLYTYLSGLIMRWTGVSTLPSQLLSLVGTITALWFLYKLLLLYFPPWSAAIAVVSFLTSRAVVFSSTSIQPDMFCLASAMMAVYFFFQWVREPRWLYWCLWVFFFALASVIKPTAMSLGIFQFCLLFFRAKQRLQSWDVWLGWLLVSMIFGLHLYHGYHVYLEYGNTFGIVGGESKGATVQQLLNPWNYFYLVTTSLQWGIGFLGACAFVGIVVLKRIQLEELLLCFAYGIAMLVALRYSVKPYWGSHYHLLGAIPAAWLVAHGVSVLRNRTAHKPDSKLRFKLFLIAALGTLLAQYAYSLHLRATLLEPGPEIPRLGRLFSTIAHPTDRVIFRSWGSYNDKKWGGTTNFEEPRFFYEAGVKGWIIAKDEKRLEESQRYLRQGACFYAETRYAGKNHQKFADFYQWLNTHSEMIMNNDDGQIYRFSSQQNCSFSLSLQSRSGELP